MSMSRERTVIAGATTGAEKVALPPAARLMPVVAAIDDPALAAKFPPAWIATLGAETDPETLACSARRDIDGVGRAGPMNPHGGEVPG
jgi:hypothetical protein